MTPETFTAIATAWLLAITGLLAWAGKWILANKDTIVQVIQAVREIRQRVDEHDDATGLNPVRKGYTDLPGPKPTATALDPIHPEPALPQSKIKTIKLSP